MRKRRSRRTFLRWAAAIHAFGALAFYNRREKAYQKVYQRMP
jgi:hypothetical protein